MFTKVTPIRTAWLWVILTFLPFLPPYISLLYKLLSDTPDAYLCFVPILFFAWSVYAMKAAPKTYQNDVELNVILGLLFNVVLLSAFIWAPKAFSLTFYGQDLCLTLWPLWGFTTSVIFFGVGALRWMWKPLLFLFLVVPQFYDLISNQLTGVLTDIATRALEWAAHLTNWLTWQGNYGAVLYHHTWVSLSITTACTGADSVMAVLLVLLYLFPQWTGRRLKKILFALLGAVIAVIMNLIRVGILITVIRIFGAGTLFELVHAVIGIFLFIAMAYALMRMGPRFGLRPVAMHALEFATPPLGAIVFSLAMTATLTTITGYALLNDQTNVWQNRVESTNLSAGVYPRLADYTAVRIGAYDDSSVLGKGAHSFATAYSNSQGEYYRVEAWTVPSAWRLEAYGVNNCLTFHGDQILTRSTVSFPNKIHASVYEVTVPPLVRGEANDIFGVVAFMYKTSTGAGQPAHYVRIEISTPIERNATHIHSTPRRLHQMEAFSDTFAKELFAK